MAYLIPAWPARAIHILTVGPWAEAESTEYGEAFAWWEIELACCAGTPSG